MGPISAIQRYLIAGASVALLLVAAWGFRVDHLRAGYLGQLEATAKVLTDAGLPGVRARSNVAVVTQTLANRDARHVIERDEARGLLASQSKMVDDWKAKSDEYAREAEANRKMAETAARLRDVWIKRAREAATRTERLSAEEELKQCEAVLDALYSRGF